LKRSVWLLAAIPLLCLCRPAAAQTFYGSTGLFVHPSAFSAPRGAIGLTASVMTQESEGHINTYAPASLSYGLTTRVEGGVMYVRHTGDDVHAHSHLGGFAKYQILPEARTRPAVAIAGTFRNTDMLEHSLATVASYRFQRGDRTLVTGHAGIKWGHANHAHDGASDVAGFLGLEYPLGQRLRLVGETSTRFSFEPDAANSLGLAWAAPNGMHVGLGFVNIGRSDSARFFFGVGYPIGGGR
jgi:hypothetical protein